MPYSDIEAVSSLRHLITQLRTVSKLATWLEANRQAYVDAWRGLIGVQASDGKWPDESIEGKLSALEAAIAGSDPLDKIAKHISNAKKAAEDWEKINDVQKIREAIAKAVEPLKSLQSLVDSETHRTVVTLSGRVSDILEDIRLRDRFSFENTTIKKKSVTVDGSFASGLKIDAALVANSSWLRALLWAFIFALREQTIEEAGANDFPLMVLDDPQTTFDPKNKIKWARRIVGLAHLGDTDLKNMQLFLTTHEPQFRDTISVVAKFIGQQGELVGPNSSSRVAHVVNGTFLERAFEQARKDSR